MTENVLNSFLFFSIVSQLCFRFIGIAAPVVFLLLFFVDPACLNPKYSTQNRNRLARISDDM